MATKVIMPEMGEGVIEGVVARWLKEEGETVEQFEPILEIETDKVTTEATAETAGKLLKIYVPAGETVEVGTVLALIGEPDEQPPETTETGTPEPMREIAGDGATTSSARGDRMGNGAQQQKERYTGRISPVVGRIAAEHDIDLSQVTGTGRDGRITKKDILAHIDQMAVGKRDARTARTDTLVQTKEEPTPTRRERTPDASPGDVVPLTTMRRAIAEHMVRSKQTSPHVTTVFEVNFGRVAAHRDANKARFARDGIRLTYTPYIVAATVTALQAHPWVNSRWSEDGIILNREIHIGMATAIDDGLIVPVIKNADGMNLLGLARTVNELAEKARHKQLQPGDVQGGTFSITNHGVSGSLFATPIINQPQCGILGVGKIEKRVVVIDDAIAIRPMAFVSFTFDHRILDGASADAFVNTIKEELENWA